MGAVSSAPVDQNSGDNRMRLQMRREAAILTNDVTCQSDLANSISEKNPEELADQIDEFFAQHKLEHDFYDAEALRALSCILKVGLTVDKQLTASQYVQEFFTNKKKIGAESVEGVAIMSGMKGAQNMFVIKAPRNPEKDNLIHEYFIAAGGAYTDLNGNPKVITGTNWLRKVCLNYSQILGAFRCTTPDIDPLSKQIRGWCNTDNPNSFVNYVIYEKIDGPDMDKLAPTIDITTFVTSMIQLAYALEIGQMYNGFTHYDLHHQNAIMRKVDQNESVEALIPFVLSEDLTVYIESHYVLTIIDYGRCHIQNVPPAVEKQGTPADHFGFHSDFGYKYGIDPEKARPYYDLYKFIGFTLYTMAESNNPTFEQAWPIMGFFGLRSRDQVIQWLSSSRGTDLFSLSKDVEDRVGFCLTKTGTDGSICLLEDESTMFDFLEYVEAQYPAIWKSKVYGYPITGKKILQCGADCSTFKSSIRDFTGLKKDNTPSNLDALGDFRSVMKYRNSLTERGNYFAETFPQSSYGPSLISSAEKLDKEIISTFPETNGPYAEQILTLGEKVKQDYLAIGYPVVYSEQPSTDPEVIAAELLNLKGYLERMSNFMKSYVEFKEFYEAGEDMTRIAGEQPSLELQDYLDREITPLYQAVDNSKGEIRRIIELTPIPPEYINFRDELLIMTA